MSVHVKPSNVNPGDPGARSGATPERVRLAGAMLAVGAIAWGIGQVIVGDKIQEGIQTLDTVTGMIYVLGMIGLVWAILATRASGDGFGRLVALGLLVILPGAFLLNVLSFGYASHDDFPLWLAILDACWPLSQLGMLVLGSCVAVARRAAGALRWLPLLAGCWFPVSVIAQIAGGSAVSVWVSAVWLIGVHAQLGVRMAVRGQLV
ncbi:hypothetical protein [Acrocarpospora catenulata]|uniref:hypothetical protein n=1 Tax=Acrocarpospora catenulata TaxID=2836182 RepID=UPI001BD9E9B6|nr:hypothetical protein [Acrocarpospora catenulata]